MPRAARPVDWLVMVMLVPAASAAAQTMPVADLPVEDLVHVQVQRVFGASERLQPVTEAPSSVTIVTADEIARNGYRTLADILRGVRGFYVTNDRNYSYVGVRGFARPGDYNTRVLLLVNGYRINDNVYDQASIGGDLGLDPAMFERVEVIRGPASALYGTSAFFAVVNVVTRSGQSLGGVRLDLDAGTLGTALARASFGQRLSNGVDVALSGTYERSDGDRQIYFPAFDAPDIGNGIAQGLDGERIGNLYGRVRVGDVTVTAAYGRRSKDVPTASFGTIFNAHDPQEHTLDEHAIVDAQYSRSFGRTRLDTRVSFGRFFYAGWYPYDGTAAVTYPDDASLGTRVSTEARATRMLRGRQTVTAGVEFIDNLRQNQWETSRDPSWRLDRSAKRGAAYVQDELKLQPWLLLNAGLRYDTYAEFERVTPRAAVIVLPSPNESFKYLYGRAFRAPNAYELYYFPGTLPRLAPESIDTHEFVWERYVGEWLRTSASTYWYTASDLITLAIVDPERTRDDNLGYANAGTIAARGLEFEAEARSKSGLQALASYVLERATDRVTNQSITNSPRHVAKMRVTVPGPIARSSASLETSYLSRRSTLAGTTVAPAFVANLTAVAPLAPSWNLVATVRNAFNAHYADPASDEHRPDTIDQNGMTFRIGIRWQMW
jgi:outer membrane cobalamin receptor